MLVKTKNWSICREPGRTGNAPGGQYVAGARVGTRLPTPCPPWAGRDRRGCLCAVSRQGAHFRLAAVPTLSDRSDRAADHGMMCGAATFLDCGRCRARLEAASLDGTSCSAMVIAAGSSRGIACGSRGRPRHKPSKITSQAGPGPPCARTGGNGPGRAPAPQRPACRRLQRQERPMSMLISVSRRGGGNGFSRHRS